MSTVRYEWICKECGTIESTTDRVPPVHCDIEMRRNWKVVRINRENLRREH